MHLPTVSHGRRGSAPAGFLVAVAIAVVGGLALSGTVAGLPMTAPSDGASGAPTAPAPAANATFNPYCAYVSGTVCVSAYNPTEPDIVPGPGQSSASVEPTVTQSIPLLVKSMHPINWTGSSPYGVDSPVAINVSGTLWNGDQYYSAYSGTTWHSATQQYYIGPLAGVTNKTYPWWYLVNITSGSGGDFYPGMAMTWWIALTYNNSGVFSHVLGPTYTYTYAGAWPYSPDPGARQYAGASAFAADVEVRTDPAVLTRNDSASLDWNDSENLELFTTTGDASTGATFGAAYVSVTESLATGVVVQSEKLQWVFNGSGTSGPLHLNFTVPASYALDPGATVRFQLTASDYYGDTVVSAVAGYTVGGNGTFVSGTFGNDLDLYASPSVAANPGTGNVSVVGPGTPIDLTLASTSPGTAINAAEVVYTVDLPAIGAVSTTTAAFARFNSTTFLGEIPGLPSGAFVNFSIYAWDFASTLEISPTWNYSVTSPQTLFGNVPENQTFFYVAVYDAGRSSWVSGARVSIEAVGGYLHSIGTTYDGMAYPNASGASYVPIVVPAGATYLVNVTPPATLGVLLARGVEVRIAVPHATVLHQVLASASDYAIIENGDILLFYLNSTAVAPVAAGGAGASLVVGTLVGLVAAGVLFVPLYLWWRRIIARREAEVKRVTL